MRHTACIFLVFLTLGAGARHQKMELQRALDGRTVKAQALSTGGYQDQCIRMQLINLSNDSLIVIIEAGRRLNSLEEKDQDILITQQEIIVLKRNEEKWFPVRGFCCQANNHSPKQNAKYGINRMADSNLVILARYLSGKRIDNHVTQQAVWAISDNRNSAQIAAMNDSLLFPLRKLVCDLKGEVLPWYVIFSKTLVYQSGHMENFPTELKGKMSYENDRACYTTLHVLNEKGMEVCKIVKQWTMPGKAEYDLSIPLAGLKKGKYTIELRSDQKELVKREFEI